MASRSEPAAAAPAPPAAAAGPLRVVLAGGGTGGHLFPGIAVAEELVRRSPGTKILFLGASGRIESHVLPPRGWELRLLDAPRSASSRLGTLLRAPLILWRLWRARRAAARLLEEFGAEVVVGLGGYAALPVVLAARQLGLPAVLLEQNARPGRTNRLLARLCPKAEVLATFAESRSAFSRPERVQIIGNPLRRDLLEALAAGRPAARRRPCLLVVGGSQGAERLNEVLGASYLLLAADLPALEVLHLTGSEAAAAGARVRMKAAGLAGEALPWSDRMGELYARADLALARAGATTLAELAAAGLPSILVPYPFAADDHQTANAEVFTRAGAAELVRQAELTPETLVERVAAFLGDAERRARMAAAARGLARPAAAREAAERVARLARPGSPG